MDTQIERLRARLREIDEQIGLLQIEGGEIETALRVLDKYAPAETEVKSEGGQGAPRPEGLPTLFEMVSFALRDSAPHGLTAAEIVHKMRARYWPGLVNQQVMPSVYRFVKESRLAKRGDKFYLPINEGGRQGE